MSDDLFERIRAAAGRVAERARWVRIDAEGLERFAATLARESPVEPAADPAHHALADPEQTLAYVVTLDAINFGSGWFPVLRKRSGQSGYLTIASALKRRFERCGAWSAAALRRLDAEDCARVFDQRDDPEARELMALFARALAELGELLERRYGGSFAALVEAADGSAARLVRSLCAMPCYRDLAWHRGEPVPLYKRAQITASDLALVFGGRGWGRFDDLSELTLFADNLVPHVLRCEGVLRYADELARQIDEGRLLAAGGEPEVEIRAVAVHAVELLVRCLGAEGLCVRAHQLDQRLWQRGQRPEIKAHPRHRARSVYY
jgi:hypothetical protein